jgi:hypothetical protein
LRATPWGFGVICFLADSAGLADTASGCFAKSPLHACNPENNISQLVHESLGFQIAERAILYRKFL